MSALSLIVRGMASAGKRARGPGLARLAPRRFLAVAELIKEPLEPKIDGLAAHAVEVAGPRRVDPERDG